jgi:hypothetical protein
MITMRFNRRVERSITLGAVGLVALIWAGCSGKKQTELVAGVSSQVQVPRDFRSVRIDVNSATGNVFCHTYPVFDGKVRLPRTLGVVAASESTFPVTITVSGFAEDVNTDSTISAFTDCQAAPEVGVKGRPKDQGGGARVLRRARQPYTKDKILYLPMPLKYSCYDLDCENEGQDYTCRGGKCMPPDIDPLRLVEFDDSLIFGDTNTCFRPFSDKDDSGNLRPGCIDAGLPPVVIDPAKCIYALPGSAGAPPYDAGIPGAPEPPSTGPGLNVRVVYDNIVSEVLDYEGVCTATGAIEGYCIPDATKPQQFQLADGICHNPVHTVTLLTASGQCPPKTELQPICDDSIQGPAQPTLLDGNSSADGSCNVAVPLTPAPSALYVLMDKSSGMRQFFGKAGLSNVIGIPLQDPVFSETQIAFKYLPAAQTDCNAAAASNSFVTFNTAAGDVPFESSFKAQADIGTSIGSFDSDAGAGVFQAGTDPWYLEAALQQNAAYKALLDLQTASQESFNRLAVLLLIDRDFPVSPTPQCGAGHADAIALAADAYAKQGIYTYVVFLKNADFPAGGVPTDSASKVAAAGQTPFFNATGSNVEAVEADALNTVVADLSGCVYEAPKNIGTAASLSFFDLLSGTVVTGVNGTSCAGDSAATPTWVFDAQRVRMCPTTCKTLVNAIKADEMVSEATNAQNPGQPPVAARGVTVTAVEPCNPISEPPIVEAGPLPRDASVPPAPDGSTADAGIADAGPG